MFVVIIEVIGRFTKDKDEAKRYDQLAYEFCRLLTVSFSATAILGAIFTFTCLGLYPKLFNYLVEVFGPTMYLYATIFFGESFSLYLYYYGWGKFSKWAHLGLGLLLNVFGVTLMLIANAWTTFMMAPGGVGSDGTIISRYAAFFPMSFPGLKIAAYCVSGLALLGGGVLAVARLSHRRSAKMGAGLMGLGATLALITFLLSLIPAGANFLLHPINIHRLIANLCLGGSVAAAYAAFKFLSTNDPKLRAHYDWMGYIGNFIAILFLLPLPFAGYYLGFEIYGFNQQLGIYMMGGALSWLFIMQAVLVGVLFLGANYYLWLGMDRIEGAERYRGWIKFLLAVVTLGVCVWGTPKSLVVTSGEIEAMHGTSHPILSLFGVMSAKNTAVNLVILTTFLSFILYRRGNKVPTVPWARLGKAAQAAAFGIAAAVVVVIGVGGYFQSMWAESTKRIAMSPKQVMAVLACMFVVMAIDIPLLKNAREVGRIRWGQVSKLSQYVLLLLAISFTWLMTLMGFVRSSLRQHWHVYEVMKDESKWAYTPSLGYATIMCTVVVGIFFLLISLIFWIANLGATHADEGHEAVEQPTRRIFGVPAPAWGGAFVVLLIGVALILRAVSGGHGGGAAPAPETLAWAEDAAKTRALHQAAAEQYGKLDAEGKYQVPVSRAMDLVLGDPTLLHPTEMALPAAGASLAEMGQAIVTKLQPCSTCHAFDAADTAPKLGPHLYGRFGTTTKITGGTTVTFDEAYITESIKTPTAKVAEGFPPVMAQLPLTDDDIKAVIEYLKTLK
jgi:cytochrome bd-type quinol oxidase subunit 1/cytochrome c2